MNVAYKHLDSKLRIADLTIGQWLSISVGVALASVWGLYVSPFGLYVTVVTAVYVGALPAAAALFVAMSEFDIWILTRSAIRWHRMEGRFTSGPGPARGYVVRGDSEEHLGGPARPRVRELDVALLWGEQA